MTLIIPKGGLEESSLLGSEFVCPPSLAIGMVQQLVQLPFSDQLVQMVPQILAIFRSVPLVLMVLVIKVLVAYQGVSSHLVWPFEERFVLNLLQNLVHWFSEHCIDCLSIGRS